ncbi:unnamed protein product, partial [marine sediment metagenome]
LLQKKALLLLEMAYGKASQEACELYAGPFQ